MAATEKKRGKPINYAAALLAVKAYTVAEIRAKMAKKEYSAGEIDTAVAACLRYGFLNDAVYAESLCAAMRSAGHGKIRIASKLRVKGIAPELIRETLEKELENDAANNLSSERGAAEKALSAKLRTLQREPDPGKRRCKALRFLAGRGFEAAAAFDAINKLLARD